MRILRLQIVQRYVLAEVFKIFALSLLGISAILMLARAVGFLHGESVSLKMLLLAFPYLFPVVLPYTLPVAMLFATSLAYGRLAADNEIVALQSSGMHLMTIVNPAILIGLVLSLAALFLNSDVIPKSRLKLREIAISNVEELLRGQLRRKKLELPGFVITFERYGGGGEESLLLEEVTIYQGASTVERKLVAERAELSFSNETTEILLVLHEGTMTTYREGKVQDIGPGKFAKEIIPVPFDRLRRLRIDLVHMTLAELWEAIPLASDKRLSGRFSRSEVRTQIQKRLSLSFACVAFVFLGVPLGILFRGGHTLSAFFISCMAVFFFYYPVTLAGEALGERELISPIVAMWAANVLTISLGAVLLLRIFKR